jgi:hypothetical protein
MPIYKVTGKTPTTKRMKIKVDEEGINGEKKAASYFLEEVDDIRAAKVTEEGKPGGKFTYNESVVEGISHEDVEVVDKNF